MKNIYSLNILWKASGLHISKDSQWIEVIVFFFSILGYISGGTERVERTQGRNTFSRVIFRVIQCWVCHKNSQICCYSSVLSSSWYLQVKFHEITAKRHLPLHFIHTHTHKVSNFHGSGVIVVTIGISWFLCSLCRFGICSLGRFGFLSITRLRFAIRFWFFARFRFVTIVFVIGFHFVVSRFFVIGNRVGFHEFLKSGSIVWSITAWWILTHL